VLRNHIGFLLFMSLLLIAPKIPLKIPGGVTGSSVSLGLAGLVLWYLSYPERLFSFPRIHIWHPLFWLIIFAIYAFVVSLLSTSIVSIAYSVQYLLYVVLSTILMKRYGWNFANINCKRARSILFAVGIIFSIGTVVSLLTGPIYPHQVRSTHAHWAGLSIQKGVGFSENQNLTGTVLIFFVASFIFLYRDKTWKKWILLSLLLFALLATLSRGAIFSFALALGFVCCLACMEQFVHKASLKVSLLKNVGFVGFTVACLAIAVTVAFYLTNKSLLSPILSGLGISQDSNSVILRDLSLRFSHWTWGMDVWASGSLLQMVFGDGFRSSMVAADYGAWRDAHNMYITILGDFGIIGLVLFLAVLFRAFFHYAHSMLTGNARPIEIFGLMTILAFSIHNMTGVFYYSPVNISLLIFTLAITI